MPTLQEPALEESVDRLHRRYAATRDPDARAALIEVHQGLAQSIAYRFCQHKHDLEDRVQVGLLGLLHAVDRFDPDRGVRFSTFAWATITGELKRFHRSSAWVAHVPRSLQELHLRISGAVEYLTVELGRSPTLVEIAEVTGDSVEGVVEGLELHRARATTSIDAPVTDDGADGLHLPVEEAFGSVDARVDVGRLLNVLPARSREIVRLRFAEDLSQSEIAARMGLSQMHISRLLAHALERLREAV